MDFYEVLDQIIDLLRQRGRMSYQALKRQFDVDDAYLEDLKVELIEVQELARDRDGKMLVWSGEAARTPESTPAPATHEPASPSATSYTGPPIAHTPPYLAEKILTSRRALQGERKQVTVLFADIKDSTELIRDLDPEDAQKLLDPAIHIMMEAVHRFEGTVNQVLGDGIMSIFGAPIAHEDHAARACYAALAMQTAMRHYTETMRRTHGIPLQIRAGLNSGEVVVRTISSDLHMDYSAVGQATHLAARMEQLATPGNIMLSGATLRLVEGLIQVNALGLVPVKGMTEPVEVFELTGASSIRRRLQAAVARGLTPFVGRGTEIEVLNQALGQAGNGHGQVVAAIGEAGAGKSRLLYEFIHSHRTQGWLVLESASVSYGKATPYFPVIDLLKRYVHLEEGDDPRSMRAKVTGQILTLDETLQETIPALLFLLDALPEDSPFLQLDPSQRRLRTLDGLKRVLLRESQVQPLLLVFEDLHWIDSETQALLESLVESLSTAPLLLLVNYRPEYQHAWGSKTFYTQVRLDPLPPESADEFLRTLLGSDPSLKRLTQLLVERTKGNPFFLEESVRALVETQVLMGETGAYRLTQDLPAIQVPATVQAILAARIDRLPQEAKQLLQTAAVIGSEVPFLLLQAIADMPEDALYRSLTHLQAAEFLYETSLFPERVHRFKHALTHEVAYGALLQERRRILHAQVAEVLEALAGDHIDDQVERLAHHALRGELWDKAFLYFRQAGAKAMARWANQEAVVCFEQALEAIQHLPDSHDTVAQGIDVRVDLRDALLPLGAYERIIDTLREAERLTEALDDPYRLGSVYVHMTHYFWSMRNLDRALVYGQRALALAESLSDVSLYTSANFVLAEVHYHLGNYEQAIAAFEQNVALLTGDLLHKRLGGVAVLSVVSRRWLVQSLAETGAFAEGITRGEEAVRIAEGADHPYSLTNACYGLGYLYLHKGDAQKAVPLFEQAVELCQVWDFRQMVTGLTLFLSHALALAGRISEALAMVEQGTEPVALTSLLNRSPGHAFVLSEMHWQSGHHEDAQTLAVKTCERAREHKERGHEAHTLRLLGDIAIYRQPPEIDEAKTHYQQALNLARELGMRPLQAHCYHGLGTLYRQTGHSEQARAELSTAIDMYRDMEMTFWLPQAEMALEQLKS